jgi:hypothetical protein
MKEITIVKEWISPFEGKLAKQLKKKGYKVSTITFYEFKEEYDKYFDENIYLLKGKDAKLGKLSKLMNFPIFLKKILKKKNTVLIGITCTTNWFISLIFFLLRNKAKRIYFPYDISFFRYKDYNTYPWHVRWSEKYNFRHCDSIIHKGPEDELKHLPKDFKALNRPEIQFLPYCDEDAMVEMNDGFFKTKLSKKDKGTHLVYVGNTYHKTKSEFDMINIFEEIVNQKLHIHVYSIRYEQLLADPDYKKLCKNKYFHAHKPIYGDDLQKELGKYDWGLGLSFIDFSKIKKEWAETALGNKISTYIEAGLPNIISDELTFSVNIVKKNKFGIIVDNINEIKNMIEQTDYNKLINDLKKNRSDFTLSNNINRLVEFIQKS